MIEDDSVSISIDIEKVNESKASSQKHEESFQNIIQQQIYPPQNYIKPSG